MNLSMHGRHLKQKGFFRAYALFILALVSVAYGAYFLGKLVPTSPKFVENQYQKIYAENDPSLYRNAGDAQLVNEYATRFDDSPSNYPDSPRTNYQPGYQSNTTVGTNPNPIQQVPGAQVILDQPAPQNTSGDQTSQPNTQPNPQTNNLTANLPTDTFESTINKRVSFQVPAGSQIKESGTDKALALTITTSEGKIFNMNVNKVIDGCFDPVKSFAIDASAPVDYRIIHDQREISLQNTFRALRMYEEYGTYAGGFGLRGNVCVQSAIPTRIEIRTANYGRAETSEAFKVFEGLITYLKV